jgi:hypothetical protein
MDFIDKFAGALKEIPESLESGFKRIFDFITKHITGFTGSFMDIVNAVNFFITMLCIFMFLKILYDYALPGLKWVLVNFRDIVVSCKNCRFCSDNNEEVIIELENMQAIHAMEMAMKCEE